MNKKDPQDPKNGNLRIFMFIRIIRKTERESGNLTFFTRLDEMQNGGKYSLRFSKGRKRRIVPTKKL